MIPKHITLHESNEYDICLPMALKRLACKPRYDGYTPADRSHSNPHWQHHRRLVRISLDVLHCKMVFGASRKKKRRLCVNKQLAGLASSQAAFNHFGLCRDVETGTHIASFKDNASGPDAVSLLGQDYLVAAQAAKGALHFWTWHKVCSSAFLASGNC